MKILFCVIAMLMLNACATLQPSHYVASTTPTPTTIVASAPLTPVTATPPPVATNPHPAASAAVTMPYTKADVKCLTDVMYFESRGESDRGKSAVGYVVMNRLKSGKFSSTVCGVVHQGVVRHGRMVRGMCQFGWYCDGRVDAVHDQKTYDHIQDLAKLILLKVQPNPVGHCLYFHEARVREHSRRLYAVRYRIEHQVFFSFVSKV